MKIVHLARDEKFMPLMLSLFEEAFPGLNRYVISRKRRARQRFVADAPNVRFLAPWRFRVGWTGGDVADADLLVVHSMTTIFAKAMRRVRPACRVVWIGWGYDYYPLLQARLGALTLPGTRALAGDDAAEEETPGRSGALGSLFARRQPALASAASRIDVCCVLPTELPMLREALPALHARSQDLPLFTVEDVFDRGPPSMEGPDVLLGNSATSSNNHAEAIEMLRGRLADDARVVVPLSYGTQAYADRVIALGRELLGVDRLEPLRGWMPIEAYNERIRRCGVVVMNHRRQQAVGNIGAALFKGAAVYLRPENPLFAFYRGLGATVRSIDDLTGGTGPLQTLSNDERAHNREVIGRYYARARVVECIRGLAAG
jgi:dTDP-N-acetylfucosamine:lipid II N-acetylfucosaminyltransferase